MSHHYENNTNAGNACAYASLHNYNNDSSSVSYGKKDDGIYFVPVFGGMSHDALTYGGSCNGYPSMNNAYGNPNKGTEYIKYPCGGSN